MSTDDQSDEATIPEGSRDVAVLRHNKVVDFYFGAPGVSEASHRLTRDRIHWMCGSVRGTDVLDIGCSGGIASVLLGREGMNVIGVDHQEDMIAQAEKLLEQEEAPVRARVQFSWAQGAKLDFPDASFDTVLLGEVLEHLVQPDRVLAEVRRVLRPSGTLIITIPYGRDETPDHKEPLYLADLHAMLQGSFGIENIELLHHWLCAVVVSGAPDADGLGAAMLKIAEARLRERDDQTIEARKATRKVQARVTAQSADVRDLRDRTRAAERELSQVARRAERSEAMVAKLRSSIAFRALMRLRHPFRRTSDKG